MSANGHAGPCDGQKSASALVEIVNGHSESASELEETGSGPKTATGTAKTARGQKGSVKSPGESARVHETMNGSWSESATSETGYVTHQTTNEHNHALHESPHHAREKTVKSESGGGPQ